MNYLCLTGIRRISLKSVWSVFAGALVSNAVADSAFISAPLQRTGVDTNASGLVTINLAPNTSSLLLQFTNLTPGRTYAMAFGGVPQGSFLVNSSGRGQVRFTQPFVSGTLPFNFDPRGKQVLILLNNKAVLRARISGPGEPAGTIVTEQATIPALPGSGGGTAEAGYQLLPDGTRRFSVTLTNVGDGNWTLFIDGIRRGAIAVTNGMGNRSFDIDPSTPASALNFEPRGVVIDIARGNTLRFNGRFQARATGINAATPSLQVRVIPPISASPLSFALVRRWVDRDARRDIDVELVNVPVGEYELYINGVFQGMVPVLPTIFGTEGEIKYASDPDDEDVRLLNFNAFGSSYIIQRDGELLFQGQPGIGLIPDTGVLVPTRIELPLFSRGVDPDGTARVQFKSDDRGRRHFEVELKNVATGDYSLMINNASVGVIRVNATTNGPRGLIEFEDGPEFGENFLTFDPLGKTIAVDRKGVRYFERTLPAIP